MATKRGTKAVKRGKRVKSLPAKSANPRQAKGVRGGAVDAFVENPTTRFVENPTITVRKY